jgi:hypothetical protein
MGQREHGFTRVGGRLHLMGCNIEGDKGNSPHAQVCGIASAKGGVQGQKEFGKACRPGGESAGKPAEVIKGGMHTCGQAEAFAIMMAKGFLKVAEKTTCTRDSKHHVA